VKARVDNNGAGVRAKETEMAEVAVPEMKGPALCSDCERDYTPAACHKGEQAFDRGYDQAVQEVLDEVCERDPDMADAIAKKYPVWARICANRKYGHT
jgi:hypothetical protein